MIGLLFVIIISLSIVFVAILLRKPEDKQWCLKEESEALRESKYGLPCKQCWGKKECDNKDCPMFKYKLNNKRFYCNESKRCDRQCSHCLIIEERSKDV